MQEIVWRYRVRALTPNHLAISLFTTAVIGNDLSKVLKKDCITQCAVFEHELYEIKHNSEIVRPIKAYASIRVRRRAVTYAAFSRY